MEVLDKDGDLIAWCSDDPEDWFRIPPREAIRLLTLKYIELYGISSDDFDITKLSEDELLAFAEKVRPDLDDSTDEALRLLLFYIQIKRNKS